jgi:deoxyribose-phosphate aldolase
MNPPTLTRRQLASMIDSTLLKSTATKNDIKKLCQDAKKHHFATVVIHPYYVKLAADALKGTDVRVGTVIGFPMGTTLAEVKAEEAHQTTKLGAQELDMVINLSALKTKDYTTVKNDIQAVTNIKHKNPNITIKTIIEATLLTNPEKRTACKLAQAAGADYVKTSTGLFGNTATIADVKLMRKTVGKNMGVKASGGIRTLNDTLAMIKAGANRIGTSAAVKIIEETPTK